MFVLDQPHLFRSSLLKQPNGGCYYPPLSASQAKDVLDMHALVTTIATIRVREGNDQNLE